jgi:mono/diheme cytochrome c family protein
MVKHYVMGPLFTPPSVRSDEPDGNKGTLVQPGGWGAGNWNTGAFDPETGMYYAVSMTQAGAFGLIQNPDAKSPMLYGTGPLPGAPRQREQRQAGGALTIDGLPIYKGPYGRITALDLNKGTIAWTVPNGDGPRNHPLVKDLHLPPLGTSGRPAPLLTKTLLFLGESSDAVMGRAGISGAAKFRAYDKASGQMIWEKELPVGTTGGPVTYISNGKQFIVLPVGGKGYGAGWLALAIAPASESINLTRTTATRPDDNVTTPAIYTTAQAKRGEAIFKDKCATCHDGNGFGPVLQDDSFWSAWGGRAARTLYSSIISSMPPMDPGSLSEKSVLDIVAYILQLNALPSGTMEIENANVLNNVMLAKPK